MQHRSTNHTILRNSNPTPTTKISPDLIFDIFSRLPVKSLVRFRCLDKLCSTFIADQSFAAAHQPHPRPKPGLLISCPTQLQSAQTFFSADLNGGPATHCLTLPPRYSRYTTQSINGIVCMDFGLCATICNPSTKQAITLPLVCSKTATAASSTYFCVNSLGFDPVSKHYKVLNSWRNYQTNKTEYRVFTLGTQSWRLLHDGPPYYPQRESICLNGFIYFRSWVNLASMEGRKIAAMVAFDVQNETFRVIKIPIRAPHYVNTSCLIQLAGRLAIVDFQLDLKNQLSLWVLEDSWNVVWVRHHIALPSSWRKMNKDYFAVGTIATGEILLAPRCLVNPFYMFYYDLERSNLRWVQICGLPGFDSLDLSRNAVAVTGYEENILSLA